MRKLSILVMVFVLAFFVFLHCIVISFPLSMG